VCKDCAYILYENPVPAVAVVLLEDGNVLLAKRKFEPKKGMWSLPAGFVEYEETPRQTAVREIKEETGLDIRVGKLLGVYAGLDDPRVHVVLIVYEGKISGGDLRAGDDAEEVRYFPLDNLPTEMAFASHCQVISNIKERLRKSGVSQDTA
jgi:ADP-ribose pyrophosphatase YjhB (NUDIX family)